MWIIMMVKIIKVKEKNIQYNFQRFQPFLNTYTILVLNKLYFLSLYRYIDYDRTRIRFFFFAGGFF